MKTKEFSEELFMELSSNVMEALDRDEIIVIKGGGFGGRAVNNGTGCDCDVDVNNGTGCGCY